MGGSAVWTSGRSYTYDNWTWLDGRTYSRRDHPYFYDMISDRDDNRNQPIIAHFRFIRTENPNSVIRYVCQYSASEEDEIKYTNWSKDWDPLTGDCFSIDALNGKWRTTQCSDKLKVVCQTDSVNVTSSKSNSYLLPTSHEQESLSVGYPTFISILIVGLCAIVVSNVIVAFVVRKCVYHRTAHVASSSETRVDTRYQDLDTTRRQANPDGTYTELQVQPLYEEVSQRKHR